MTEEEALMHLEEVLLLLLLLIRLRFPPASMTCQAASVGIAWVLVLPEICG